MELLAGTSGFSYREWKGAFYPADLPAQGMLGYYATRLSAVEINNTFYRQPTEKMLRGWLGQVPHNFRFSIKAPRRITHIKRLRDCGEETARLLAGVEVLAQTLASILFQLPPGLRRDVGLLSAFIELLPSGTPAAFEFRHDSWFEEAVFERLAEANMPLVLAQTDAQPAAQLPFTADWAYLRLRKASYADDELDAWLGRLSAARLRRALVFFKHEDEAAGPRMAERLLQQHRGGEAAPR